MSPPLELTMELSPKARFDAIDVAQRAVQDVGEIFNEYERVLYCSHHTTAGFLDQGQASRLDHRREKLAPYIRSYQDIFPEDGGYTHDKMHLRTELSDEQRRVEPPNGDAHLTFIGSGLRSCVTYLHRPATPVFLMDLDGVYKGKARTRRTSVIAYNNEEAVDERTFSIPVSHHSIDSINLADEQIGLMPEIREMLVANGVEHGRVDIDLDQQENASALTINEFETLLMRHDLAEVLQNPLRFMARQGRRMLRDPRAVPAKSIGYAKYDVVRLLNKIIDAMGLGDSTLEQLLSKAMAVPARRLLHWKRSVSLPVSNDNGDGPHLVRGQYQSPILIQWGATPSQIRSVRVRLTRFS